MGSQAPHSPSKFTEKPFTSCASSVTVPGGPQHTVWLWSPKERKLGKIVSIFYLKGHLNHFFVLFTHSKETTNVLYSLWQVLTNLNSIKSLQVPVTSLQLYLHNVFCWVQFFSSQTSRMHSIIAKKKVCLYFLYWIDSKSAKVTIYIIIQTIAHFRAEKRSGAKYLKVI